MQISIWGMQDDKIRICTLVCAIRQRLIIHIHPLYLISELSDSHTSKMIRLQSTSFVGFQRVGKKHAEQIVVTNVKRQLL